MKLTVVLGLSLGCINILVAQDDFVVTNKNDTIYGEVITTTFNGFITGEAKIKYKDENGKQNKRTLNHLLVCATGITLPTK